MRYAYRKPYTALSAEDRERLVRMRDDGATWMAIGRALGIHDSHGLNVYRAEKARASATESGNTRG
ncbi:hypothetical protein [Caulobacter sp. S45]|uniref:hypothetical protein n=1 Tax=Caulobacter sp. S45 TaxID=1641861 RepID=UPI00131BAB0C|nr:hypothetical protein [Caulobacter sp. S45]